MKPEHTSDATPSDPGSEDLIEKHNTNPKKDTVDNASKATANVDNTVGQETNDRELSGKNVPDSKTDIAGDSSTANGDSTPADTKKNLLQQLPSAKDESQSMHDKHEATNDVSKNVSADRDTVIETPIPTKDGKETGHSEAPKLVDNNNHEAPEAQKTAPEKVTNAPAKTTNKPSSNNGAVKTPEPDKKAKTKTSEETKTKAKDNTDLKESDHSLEKKDEAQETAKASQTAESYQLHGIDSQGNSLFNKTVRLTPNEATNFRTKNIEFYGYELQSTDLNTHAKVLTLHYTAKKVTFNIVNVDQDGKTLSKDTIQLDFGQTKTYTAKFIPGYQAELASKELNADNLMPEEVRFTYTKLADSSKQLAQEKHSVAAKQTDSKHKHGHGDKGDTADSHQLHDKDEVVHTDGATQEKLPQTGEHNSYFTILTGVALLIGLVGKKLFKRLN